MLLYRVFPYLDGAVAGEPGHATYVYPRQGGGRWDSPGEYLMVYAAESPEAAIAETFGRIPVWSDDMFDTPSLPGARSALATFELDNNHDVLDLDDAGNLLDRNLRPTQVVIRDLPFTQPLALNTYRETNADGSRRWAGIRWWSFWAPQWPVYAIWIPHGEDHPLRLFGVNKLTATSPIVKDAAATIVRDFV